MLLLSHDGYTQMTVLRALRMNVLSKRRDLLMAQLQVSKPFLYLQCKEAGKRQSSVRRLILILISIKY